MRRQLFGVAALGVLSLFLPSVRAADEVTFNRDIRPILSDHCFACHGPDSAQRKADLRLDVEANAKADLDGARPIVPHDVEASEAMRRITSTDPEVRMPPDDTGKPLSSAQIDLVRRWIAAGAKWEAHWSLIPPVSPPTPATKKPQWLRNPLDAFVLARLETAGLAPAAEADRATLIRRVTLDLTGWPPTPEEVDRFLTDASGDAYERVVDRLLSSPRYGERMAARWLDAARYADTSGYQTDGIRSMWRWRDWVINAYNSNMPFDRFSIEQIAGDLLPGATLEQRIATGFNRNHRGNAEGGIIPEEYAVEYVVDRVDTTATVWLGLTMACARCHDHKFDPITQREFYQVFAFFNNIPEKGRAVKVGNSPPLVKTPTRHEQEQQHALGEKLTAAQREFAALEGQIAADQARWESSLATEQPLFWAPGESLVSHFPFDDNLLEQPSGAAREGEGEAKFATGIIGRAAAFNSDWAVNAGNVANFGYFDKFTLAAWIQARGAEGTLLARMSDQSDGDGYSLVLADGKLQVNLVKRWLDDSLRVETEAPLSNDTWHHVAVTYDGSRVASGVKIYVDGQQQQIKILLDELNQSFSSTEPLRLGGGGIGPRFAGLIDDVRIYKTDLNPAAIELLATPEAIDVLARRPVAERSAAQGAKLRAYFLDQRASEQIREALARVIELRRAIDELEEGFPTTMVMEEMPTPRPTFVLARGQYDRPGERVEPDAPACLPRLPQGSPRNRLALARWLVDPANPLTARVAVNRLWQSFFGAGIVKTVDDFGAQGDAPSHQDLLDWLATRFVSDGWDTKALARLIVTSATYRQSSKIAPGAFERDPENRLLARGPRLRLPAEAIHDQALAASGLLTEEIGGPSVQPYQPAGLWKELSGAGDSVQDHGANLYRRGLYTFWKRTVAPPTMMTFDAAGREACTVRETRTNTPLQALTLLNEITFVEAARVLAERAMHEVDMPEQRLVRMFRLVLARAPVAGELQILSTALARHRGQFREQPAAAEKLLRVGEAPADSGLDPCELAAYAAVANLIFNLDEAVTKE